MFLCLLIILLLQIACNKNISYLEKDFPMFISNEVCQIGKTENNKTEIKAISYNLKHGEKVDMAIMEFTSIPELMEADVILLQEMNENALVAMAKGLNMNYVYFPASYNQRTSKNFGTAILTNGKIENQEKLILPHKKWSNGRRRFCTKADIVWWNRRITVYSAHTETIEMSRKKRMDQLDSLITNAIWTTSSKTAVIIAGDFNTLWPKEDELVRKKFEEKGFTLATANLGSTIRNKWYGPTLDYIFCRGLEVLKSGKCLETASSDHFPVYAQLKINS